MQLDQKTPRGLAVLLLLALLGGCGSSDESSGGDGGSSTSGVPFEGVVLFKNVNLGGNSVSYTFSRLPGFDIKASRASGSSSVVLEFKNRYESTIHFSYDLKFSRPSKAGYRTGINSGDSITRSFLTSSSSFYVRIERVRLGSPDTGPYYEGFKGATKPSAPRELLQEEFDEGVRDDVWRTSGDVVLHEGWTGSPTTSAWIGSPLSSGQASLHLREPLPLLPGLIIDIDVDFSRATSNSGTTGIYLRDAATGREIASVRSVPHDDGAVRITYRIEGQAAPWVEFSEVVLPRNPQVGFHRVRFVLDLEGRASWFLGNAPKATTSVALLPGDAVLSFEAHGTSLGIDSVHAEW